MPYYVTGGTLNLTRLLTTIFLLHFKNPFSVSVPLIDFPTVYLMAFQRKIARTLSFVLVYCFFLQLWIHL